MNSSQSGLSQHIPDLPAFVQARKNTGKEAQTRMDAAIVSNPSRRCRNNNTVVGVEITRGAGLVPYSVSEIVHDWLFHTSLE
jgi:hypothetical protein